ncbi:MAG: alkaline phosphatase family protein, partial [Chloroflexota bacterium]|nr:alkaline phosphatase family protein [Chloroflexota bacterium]
MVLATAMLAACGALPGAAPPPTPVPPPPHVFVIVMENHGPAQILGNPEAPYLNELASTYAVADEYFAVSHPSLPNYLALVGGDTFGVTSNCTDCVVDGPNLADALLAHGKTWKSYQEDLPSPCFLGASSDNYVLRHNPFLYFQSIRDDPARCGR